MDMESETSAAFTLTGQRLDPDLVTAAVGIAPSVAWRTGDLIQAGATLRYRHNGWRLRSGLAKSADLEEHIRSVLEQLQNGWKALAELGDRYDAEMACTVYSYGGDRPALHVGKDIIARLAEVHAAVDIDLFVLPARSDGESTVSETG